MVQAHRANEYWSLRKLVRHVNAHTVPFHSLNGRTMDLAIEPPAISAKSWREFMLNFFSNQMKDLRAIEPILYGSVVPFGVMTGA